MEDHEMEKRLHDLETEVKELLLHRTSANVNAMHDEKLTPGDRMADAMANGAGSWRFIIAFLAFLFTWIAANVVGAIYHWDPYPFILLNLILSCVAALQAPVILMSQNRLEERDRLRAENDYEVNVKAERLLEHLTAEIEGLKMGLVSLGAHLEPPDGPTGRPDAYCLLALTPCSTIIPPVTRGVDVAVIGVRPVVALGQCTMGTLRGSLRGP